MDLDCDLECWLCQWLLAAAACMASLAGSWRRKSLPALASAFGERDFGDALDKELDDSWCGGDCGSSKVELAWCRWCKVAELLAVGIGPLGG